MNKIIIKGGFTKDPTISTYGEGENKGKIANFSVGVNRRIKREGDPDSDFFNCTAFGKTAEFVEKYFKKGRQALIEGRVQNDNYEDKDGNKVYGFKVIVESIEFADSKPVATGNSEAPAPQESAPAPAPAPSGSGDGFMNIPDGVDEELPFN